MDDIYHQVILTHCKSPQNFGKLSTYSAKHTEANQSCGDSFTFYLQLNQNNTKVESISFTGEGCAISKATASLLTQHVRSIDMYQLRSLKPKDILELIGIDQISPTRIKCLTLPLIGIQTTLENALNLND